MPPLLPSLHHLQSLMRYPIFWFLKRAHYVPCARWLRFVKSMLASAELPSGRGLQVVTWICDPMHGNTECVNNYKTRRYENIRAEVEAFFDVHDDCGEHQMPPPSPTGMSEIPSWNFLFSKRN